MIELMASTLRDLGALTATDFAAAGSPQGRAWLAAVPSVVDDLVGRWQLTITTDHFRNGYSSIVVLADQGGRPLALKLSWPPGKVRDEAHALTAWRGHGVVELIACDLARGALLLERLDASRSLASIPVAEAAAAAGALIRTLAIEPSGPFPALRAAARQLATTIPARQHALADPLPDLFVTLAARLAANLARDPAHLMVHTDLHYGNILAGRGWVAIDPSAAQGAPERSTAELLWTRVDELPDAHAIVALLDTIVDNGQLDRAKSIAWSFVRAVDYWLWALENSLTVDPLRCERVAAALAPLAG
jgi:streptomycin 6-kinase